MGLDPLKQQIIEMLSDINREEDLRDVVNFVAAKRETVLEDPGEEYLTEDQAARIQQAARDFHNGRRDNLLSHEEVMKKYKKWL